MEPRFEILYHPDVLEKDLPLSLVLFSKGRRGLAHATFLNFNRRVDLPRISSAEKQRIWRAIEQKLAFFPHEFGAPLRHTLKGYWKLRVGDWRVIYKMQGRILTILRMGHRREIYGTQP